MKTSRQLTYEEFSDLGKWEKTGDGNGGNVWQYVRSIGDYRVSVWFSGNDLFWKWAGDLIEEEHNPIRRMTRTFVYDCGGTSKEEAFKEAYEMMSAKGVLVLGEGQR